jgi:hypothetical protein
MGQTESISTRSAICRDNLLVDTRAELMEFAVVSG